MPRPQGEAEGNYGDVGRIWQSGWDERKEIHSTGSLSFRQLGLSAC